jgi:uncharacterized membrane protein (UPF0127 family)
MKIKIENWVTAGATLLIVALAFSGCGNQSSSATNAPSATQPSAAPAATNRAPTNEIDPVYGHLTHAQPKLPTIKVWLGSEELTAEMALRPLQIATGMMFRTNMLEHEAMIFVFGDPAPRSFYMRNCTVPLSAAYINPEGVIEEIAKLEPGNEVGVLSKSQNIQFVLEVPQGWFDRHNVRTGAMVRTPTGSLRDTFIRR